MASVGGITVATMRGTAQRPGEELVEITRPRVDGVALKRIGSRPRRYVLTTTHDIVASAAETEKAAVMALKGTLVTVVDSHGNSIDDQAVLDVTCTVRAAAVIVGGITAGSDAVMVCTWTMLDAGAAS